MRSRHTSSPIQFKQPLLRPLGPVQGFPGTIRSVAETAAQLGAKDHQNTPDHCSKLPSRQLTRPSPRPVQAIRTQSAQPQSIKMHRRRNSRYTMNTKKSVVFAPAAQSSTRVMLSKSPRRQLSPMQGHADSIQIVSAKIDRGPAQGSSQHRSDPQQYNRFRHMHQKSPIQSEQQDFQPFIPDQSSPTRRSAPLPKQWLRSKLIGSPIQVK